MFFTDAFVMDMTKVGRCKGLPRGPLWRDAVASERFAIRSFSDGP